MDPISGFKVGCFLGFCAFVVIGKMGLAACGEAVAIGFPTFVLGGGIFGYVVVALL